MQFLFRLTPRNKCSGGMRAAYYFTTLLRKAGHRVKVNTGYDPDKDIVVYPDSVPGNVYKAHKVIRYFFYYADAYFRGTIGADELIIVYHQDYLKGLPPTTPIITIPSIEPKLFFPAPKTIEGVVYVGKGGPGGTDKKHNYADPIPRRLRQYPIIYKDVEQKGARIQTAKLLRHAKNFYSLDYHTIACTEAALCGCNVFHVKGEELLEPVTITDPESMVMNFQRDLALAHRFVDEVTKWLKT